MKTENSYYYFRGREARGLGESREHGARMKDALRRAAWCKGWDDEDSLQEMRPRPPEVALANAEGREWFDAEVKRWMEEEIGYLKTEDAVTTDS